MKIKRSKIKNWIVLFILILFFVLIMINEGWRQSALSFLFPAEKNLIYSRISLVFMLFEHLKLVVISSSITVISGILIGTLATRSSLKDFLDIINNFISIGQTFPPVAVLALAVPVFGFGFVPAIIALILYGLLPVVRNTITGLQSVPQHYLDVAYGLGMNKAQALFKVEIPMSAKIIIAGIRISVTINIGTAVIGAVIGAGGLGTVVIAGLVQDNISYVIQGVVPAAFLAVIADRFFAAVEDSFYAY